MSSLDDLLSRMRAVGIRLWIEEGQLKYRAPKNALTPDLLTELKEKKQDLIALLSKQKVFSAEVVSYPHSRPSILPLSFSQQRLWFLFRMEEKGSAYNISAALRFKGPLDLLVLKQCFEVIADRHEILRTRFAESSDGIPAQVVEPKLVLPWESTDLSALSKAESERQFRKSLSDLGDFHFDLRKSPLFRIHAITLGSDDHVLSLVMHHILADGWSIGIIVEELAALYPQLLKGVIGNIPPLTLQYADFAIQQRQRFAGAACDQQKEFWLKQLHGAPLELELPTDFSRGPRQTFSGTIYNFTLTSEVSDQLHATGVATGTTPFMNLLAAFGVTLEKYTGQNEMLIGTTSANRQRHELEPLIGFFVNTIALRIDLRGNPTFSELLQRVKTVCLDSYENQEFPFEQVVDALQPGRSMNRPPLVQVIFRVENSKMVGNLEFPDIAAETVELPRKTSTFDLSLSFAHSDSGWEGAVEYNTDLFKKDTVERLAKHFQWVVKQLLVNPKACISECTLLDPVERKSLLSIGSGPAAGLKHENLISALRESVRLYAPVKAVVSGNDSLTYRQLDDQSSSFANRLRRLGVKSEDIVAFCLPRSVELIVAILGILKSGAAYLPLDPTHPRERHRELLRDTRSKIVITNRQVAPSFEDFQVVLVDPLQDSVEPDFESNISANQAAYVIYTSGSTGKPKGVVIEHRSVLNLVEGLSRTIYRAALKPLRVALIAPVIFDASVQQIFGSLLLGHTLHIVDEETRKDGNRLWRFFQDQEIHLTDGTPAMLNLLVGAGMDQKDFRFPQHFVIGGEALPRSVVKNLLGTVPCAELTNIYGPTECCVDATSLEFETTGVYYGEVLPIGRPLANASCYILDSTGNQSPIGVWGELFIGGLLVGRGYWNRPDLTAEKFVPDPFSSIAGSRLYRSGDVTRFTSDGIIEFAGRHDEQVKVNGYRIELAEVEMHLQQHPKVRQAASFVRPSAAGKELVACVVPRDQLSIEEIRSYLDQRIPAYLIPSQFFITTELPLNSSGKLDRNKLRMMSFATTLPSANVLVQPRNILEQTVADVWRKVLARETLGIHDNFFFSGGDSIKALQIVSAMRQHQFRMEVRDIFLYPTIASLAPRVVKMDDEQNASRAIAGTFSPTPVQAEFLNSFRGNTAHYNQAVLLSDAGTWREESLRLAFEALHTHHDALKIRLFATEKGFVSEQCGLEFPVSFTTIDLRSSLDPAQDLTSHAEREQTNVDLQKGPLLRAILYIVPTGQRLLLISHHWIIDGVSWRILLEDFAAAYNQASAGENISLPAPSHSFQFWSQNLEAYARNRALLDLEFWMSVENQQIPKLELDLPGNSQPQPNYVQICLDSQRTRSLLTECNAPYNTEVNDLLLTALVRAIDDWKGENRVAVLLEGHGREEIIPGVDLSRTVGWFTTLFPVLLRVTTNRDIGWQIREVKEILRSVPAKGIGYGVLKYLTPKDQKSGMEFRLEPQISFNYLGESQGEGGSVFGAPATEEIGPLIDPTIKSRQDLELVGMVQSGIFEMTFHYDAQNFSKQSIEAFSAGYREQILAIIEHTMSRHASELTPSDIDHKGFDLEKLEHFLKQF